MEKLLTKEEIDALVAAVADGTLVPETELHSGRITRIYGTDFVVR